MSNSPVRDVGADLNAELLRVVAEKLTPHVQQCLECQVFAHPPRYFCTSCQGESLAFVPVTGAGVVYSWSVSHMSTDPAWSDRVPFLTLVVELAEGVRVVAETSMWERSPRLGESVRVSVRSVSEVFGAFHVEPPEVNRESSTQVLTHSTVTAIVRRAATDADESWPPGF